MPPSSGQIKENPLYIELGEIGRQEKSLQPAALLNYETLLHCTAVNRMVAASATDLQRARAASRAIKQIVDDIADPGDSRIAQAALCTVDKYVGATVDDRKSLLDREYGITAERYGQRRQFVVASVVDALEEPRPDRPKRIPDPGRDDPVGYNRLCLWRDAFTLHCSGLASLYVMENPEMGLGEHPAVEACSKSLFDALTIFLYSTYQSSVAHPDTMEEWVGGCLDQETIAWLLRTIRTLNDYCPLLQQLDDESEDGLLYYCIPGATKNGIHVRDLYTSVWKPWYFAERGSADVLVSIERITGKAGAISAVLHQARCTGVNQPLEKEIQSEAFDALDRYYGYRTNRPLKTGETLRESFDTFCRLRSRELVKNEMP